MSSSLDRETTVPQNTRTARRLVLCFDGTGSKFQGTSADTNVVKLYNKFDRDCKNQVHYYQTGIGTYDTRGGSLNKSVVGKLRSKASRIIDQGFATSFDAHVIAGYRFIMRYYNKGDKIYLFGFSRGAFTARFLAGMIHTVGLLSRGNDELIPFAYQLFQNYVKGKIIADEQISGTEERSQLVRDQNRASVVSTMLELEDTMESMRAFSETFCHRGMDEQRSADDRNDGFKNVKVHFLGIFDCVNSVAVLESPFGKSEKRLPVFDNAMHVRHAVAVDERRVKFKVALFDQDKSKLPPGSTLKEVWFAGDHVDIGGGRPAQEPFTKPSSKSKHRNPTRLLENITRGRFPKLYKQLSRHRIRQNYLQASDVALSWMIHELEDVCPELAWNQQSLRKFKAGFQRQKKQALHANVHDNMRVGGGASMFEIFMWNLLERIPFVPRWEINSKGTWYYERVTPNWGSTRDIPKDAILHESLRQRLERADSSAMEKYNPQNNHGGSKRPCLRRGESAGRGSTYYKVYEEDKTQFGDHTLWKFGGDAS